MPLKFERYLMHRINWNNRLIAIKGARGSGKTTLVLQYIARNLPKDHTVLYISMEDMYFYRNTLLALTDEFVLNGGKFLFLDEVHKYPNWAREIKLIYDKYKDLKIVFTSSSILEIYKAKSDLSRRIVAYYLNELSIREYISIKSNTTLPIIDLDTMLKEQTEITREITKHIRPVYEFNQYLMHGVYPYFIEGIEEYPRKLQNTINLVIENDIPAVYNLDFYLLHKIKKLLYAVASSVPFKPNISQLSQRVGVSRPTLLSFLDYLEKAEIIYQLYIDSIGVSSLAKPEKIYLHNSNLLHVIARDNFNRGNIRETFFLNQLSVNEQINYSKHADFIVNNKIYFEIGGKNKTKAQVKALDNAYIVKDDIEAGIGNVIPIWLFGFMY